MELHCIDYYPTPPSSSLFPSTLSHSHSAHLLSLYRPVYTFSRPNHHSVHTNRSSFCSRTTNPKRTCDNHSTPITDPSGQYPLDCTLTMLSSSPAVPISSFNFSDDNRRRLSFVTEHGREFNTLHHDGASSNHLSPITGNTPAGHTPDDSPAGSAAASRRQSHHEPHPQERAVEHVTSGMHLTKVQSRGGLWTEDVSRAFFIY